MYTSIHVLRQRLPPAQFFQASYALSRSAGFRHVGDFDRSKDWIQKCLKAMPFNAEASYNAHLDFLKAGDYKQGYGAYFLAGKALKVMDRAQSLATPWTGQNLKGKTLLICTENGYGDVFVSLRFLKRLKSRFQAQRIIVRSHFEDLVDFLKQVPEIDDVYFEKHKKDPNTDFFVSTSLLNYYACEGYEDLPGQPYLKADPDLQKIWKQKLSGKSGLKVGLRWAGNPQFQGNEFRKFDPDLLFQAVKNLGLNLFSFQRDEDLVSLPSEITDLSKDLSSWNETAAALANLDIMITSCTAVAHLSAALGVETWLCVPVATFHTWAYSEDGVHTPWYDSVRMYKQKNVYYWDEVFEKIHQDLKKRVGQDEIPDKNFTKASFREIKVSKPFHFPEGRKPLLPFEHTLFNIRYNEALKKKNVQGLLDLYKKFPGSLPLNTALSGYFLDQGDFQKGYRGFDLIERSLSPNIRLLPKSPIPEWTGQQDLKGKTIVVASGQGQGADLLVGRLIPQLRQLGAQKIIGSVHVFMSDFFIHQNFYDEILPETDAIHTKADYWVRINSLIYLLNQDFSDLSGVPYVTASPARVRIWKEKLQAREQNGKLKVGLRFAGNPQFGGNADRLFDPSLLVQAADQKNVQAFSFQRDADIPNLPSNIVDLSKDLKTWDDTAAALSQMDLVISSCTSVGHLAAAMGIPTWFCVPYEAYHCWRSPLGLDGKTYWYDSAKVFRQNETGNWEEVFERVKKEITTYKYKDHRPHRA